MRDPQGDSPWAALVAIAAVRNMPSRLAPGGFPRREGGIRTSLFDRLPVWKGRSMPGKDEEAGSRGSAPADLVDLRNVESQLALATDAGNWSDFLDCFVEGAEADYGELGAGPIEQIAGLIQESQARYQGTMNVVGTHLAAVDGNRARAETYVVSHHFRLEGEQSWDDQAGTHYVDDFVRTALGWRIDRRVAQLRWFRSDSSSSGWI